MPIPAYRAKQSTDTSGTGTIVLNAAGTNARSFAAAFGASSRRIMYCISWASGFEIGYGDFDGGTPGNLTRATVVASSNAGALVTLPAGTKDVFAVFDPGAREVLSISGTTTLTLADMGNAVVFTGASAATVNLPAISGVPQGAGWMIVNAGTGALTIDPNGAETVNFLSTLVLRPGQTATLLRTSSVWQAAGSLTGFYQQIRQQSVVNSSAVEFTLDSSYRLFLLQIDRGRVATTGQGLNLRCGVGATFDAGANNYSYGYISHTGGTPISGSTSASSIDISGTLLAGESRSFIEVMIDPGSASASFIARSSSGVIENTTPSFRIFNSFGAREANGVKDAIRILASGGSNISGTFTLLGIPA